MLHVLNLAVQTLLKELKAEAVDDGPGPSDGDETAAAAQANQMSCIAKLRQLVTMIRNSPKRRHELYNQCKASKVPKKALIRDVCTRWGPTYDMFRRACELRQPLSTMARLSRDLPELDDDEWGLVKVSISQLFFLDATVLTAMVMGCSGCCTDPQQLRRGISLLSAARYPC